MVSRGLGADRRKQRTLSAVRRAAVLVTCILFGIAPLGCSLFGRFTRSSDPGPISGSPGARAFETASPSAAPTIAPDTSLVDRVVVRWFAPETGGVGKPQIVFARELSFEARLEAFADPDPDGVTYRDRHVRAALDRHVAETLLASLTTVPEPTVKEIAQRAEDARKVLEQRIGNGDPAAGHDRLLDAASAEGISSDELDGFLRRQAKASLYLDRMVAPMLEPTELELLALHRSGQTPFSSRPFEDVKGQMKRWYIAVRLAQALETYYQNARSRVTIVTVKKP